LTWFDQMDEERKKRQQILQTMLSQAQTRNKPYQPDYKGAKSYFDQAAQQQKKQQATTVKQDTSKHHSLLDSLMNNFKTNIAQDQKDWQNSIKDGVDFKDILNLAVKPLSYMNGGGGDVLRGMVGGQASKNQTDSGMDNWEKDFGSNFTAGVGDIVKGTGDTLKWIGSKNSDTGWADKAGNAISNFGQKNLIDDYQRAYGKPFAVSSLLDPSFYSSTVARSLPFTLAMIAPSILGASAGSALGGLGANAMKLGKAGQVIMRTLGAGVGGSTVSVPLEAAFEGANVYDDAIKKGMTPEQANEMANKTFKGNLALLAGTQIPETALTFAHLGGFNPSKIARAGLLAGSAAIEGGQEAGQEVISAHAKGEKVDKNAMAESFAVGALMGGVSGLAGVGGESHDIHAPDPQEPQRRRAEQILGGADPYTVIRTAVRNRMSDDLKSEADNVRDQLESQGLDPDEIDRQVDEFIATTDEGEKLFQEETVNLNNRLTPQDAPTPNQADPAQNGIDEATRQVEATQTQLTPDQPQAQQEPQPQGQHPLQTRYTDVMRQYNDLTQQNGSPKELKKLDKQLTQLESQMTKLGVAVPQGDMPTQQAPAQQQPAQPTNEQGQPVQPTQQAMPTAEELNAMPIDERFKYQAEQQAQQPVSEDAQGIKGMFDGIGQGIGEAAHQKTMDDVAKQGYTEFQKAESADLFRNNEQYKGWKEEKQPNGAIRFYPPAEQNQETKGSKTLEERRKEHEAKRQEQQQGQEELAALLDENATPEEAAQDLGVGDRAVEDLSGNDTPPTEEDQPYEPTKGESVRHTSTGMTATYDGEVHPNNPKLFKVHTSKGNVQYWSKLKMKPVQSEEKPKVDHEAKKQDKTGERVVEHQTKEDIERHHPNKEKLKVGDRVVLKFTRKNEPLVVQEKGDTMFTSQWEDGSGTPTKAYYSSLAEILPPKAEEQQQEKVRDEKPKAEVNKHGFSWDDIKVGTDVSDGKEWYKVTDKDIISSTTRRIDVTRYNGKNTEIGLLFENIQGIRPSQEPATEQPKEETPLPEKPANYDEIEKQRKEKHAENTKKKNEDRQAHVAQLLHDRPRLNPDSIVRFNSKKHNKVMYGKVLMNYTNRQMMDVLYTDETGTGWAEDQNGEPLSGSEYVDYPDVTDILHQAGKGRIDEEHEKKMAQLEADKARNKELLDKIREHEHEEEKSIRESLQKQGAANDFTKTVYAKRGKEHLRLEFNGGISNDLKERMGKLGFNLIDKLDPREWTKNIPILSDADEKIIRDQLAKDNRKLEKSKKDEVKKQAEAEKKNAKPLGVIDENTPLPNVEYKEAKTRIHGEIPSD
jgi:hypothetical protein